jgi:transposase
MEQKQTRKQYTKQFKLDVIAQSYQRDNIRELATELGLAPALIYKWRAVYGSDGPKAFPGNGIEKLTLEEAELRRLQQENADLRMERDILKKAIGIFTSRRG